MWHPDRIRRYAACTTVDLTTTGRRTGLPRRIEIWWFRFEGRFVVTGTPGRRDWLANIHADPRVTIHVDGDELAGVAVPIEDESFRRRFFESGRAAWYATQADVEELVSSAPMVAIRPA